MNLILLGCPGAGKGTQSSAICQRFNLAHISTGDIFREEIGWKTELGGRVAEYVNSGRLVPDALVLESVTGKLDGPRPQNEGFLLDGFPRTLEQAEALDGYLKGSNKKIDAVIFLDINEEVVIKRLMDRRNCPKCGLVYNLTTNPPKKEGVCDKCQGPLNLRNDDAPATVSRRIMVYRDLTQPLVAYYRANYVFHEVNGAADPREVTEKIVALLEK